MLDYWWDFWIEARVDGGGREGGEGGEEGEEGVSRSAKDWRGGGIPRKNRDDVIRK